MREKPTMIVLGIETATERLGAALIADGTVRERHIDSRSSHCELLTGFIVDITEEAGIELRDVEGIAVSIGPGSFTGLRIGIATAMGLAYGLGIETTGVNTLAGLAWKAAGPGALVCPVIDARRSEAYTAVYRLPEDGLPETVLEARAVPIAKLGEMLAGYGEPVTVTGPAVGLFRETLERATGASLVFRPPGESKPSAVSIAETGAVLFDRGMGGSPAALTPLYLRRSDAELARDRKRRSTC